MALFPAVRCDEVRAIARTVDAHFAPGTAIDGADLLTEGGTIPLGASFITDWADLFVSHWSLVRENPRRY